MTRFNTDVATLPIVFMNFLNSINHLKYYQFMKSNTKAKASAYAKATADETADLVFSRSFASFHFGKDF